MFLFSDLRVELDWIFDSIKECSVKRAKHAKNVLIKMCKSSTPESKWNFLEEKFIDKNLEVISLKSLQIYLIATDK